MSGSIRAFLAVEVSDTVRIELGRLVGRLGNRPGPRVRWVRPELMHLTLVFLGEVAEGFVERAVRKLERVTSAIPCFDCRFSGLGAFPGPAKARVVWVGVGAGRDELRGLQVAVAGALEQLGFRSEGRAFTPHLTLGRLREPADVRPLVEGRFESETFRVAGLTAFRSVLGPGGPEYTQLAFLPLKTA
ncbi:MAG: RNA 2',3'-cyclic phosphodiesterase [candidate division WOR-3 bacterium]